jgi:hypothetical protein
MNALIALAALALSGSAQANAQETYCHSTDIVDGGYVFTFSADRKTALLQEQTFHGPRPLAEMECEKLHVKAIPDAHQNTVFCHAYNVGGGLVVRVYEGGFFFHRTAQLSQTTVLRDGVKETPVQYGKMACDRGF